MVLPNHQTKFPMINQKGQFWCIPACIESMIKYLGITNLTQEEMVLDYCKKYGNNALVKYQGNQRIKIPIDGLNDVQLIQLAYNSALCNASFFNFKDIIENRTRGTGLIIEFKDGIKDATEYLGLIRNYMFIGQPVLIASTNPNGSSHIRVVLEDKTDSLVLFDPALKEENVKEIRITDIKFNHDLLTAKRTQKKKKKKIE